MDEIRTSGVCMSARKRRYGRTQRVMNLRKRQGAEYATEATEEGVDAPAVQAEAEAEDQEAETQEGGLLARARALFGGEGEADAAPQDPESPDGRGDARRR